ncbi:oxidoreductase [Klebsiella variicola]|nr:oxidoreductase [Klebsiella variicola]
MHYIPLGDTALRVSRLCLGCMTFGEPDRGRHAWTLPEESSRPLIQHAIEGGINFFDTANSYSDGSSEEIVGRALRDFARRDEVVVATKVYHQVDDLAEGLSRAQILRSIDDSLRRLGMDYVDLLQIHRWDYTTPIEETLEALGRGGESRQSALYRRLVHACPTVCPGAGAPAAERLGALCHHAGSLQSDLPGRRE